MAERYALIGAHLYGDDAAGVPTVRCFDLGGLFASAIEFESAQGLADPAVIRRALEARKELIARETFIAIRYGASVAGAEEARSLCAPHLDRWRRILVKRRGMVEVTLRVAGKRKATPLNRREFRSGGEYLRALHRQRQANLDPAVASRIEALFAPLAAERTWVGRADGSSELAMLVPRAHLEAVGPAADELKARLPELPFLISGPWPLETFAHEEG